MMKSLIKTLFAVMFSLLLTPSHLLASSDLLKNGSTIHTRDRSTVFTMDVPKGFKPPFSVTVTRNEDASSSPQIVADHGITHYPDGSSVASHTNIEAQTTREYTYPDYQLGLTLTLCRNEISAKDGTGKKFSATIIRNKIKAQPSDGNDISPGQMTITAPDGTTVKAIKIHRSVNSKGESVYQFQHVSKIPVLVTINLFDEYHSKIEYRDSVEVLKRPKMGRNQYHSMNTKTLHFKNGEKATITQYLERCEEAQYNPNIWIISTQKDGKESESEKKKEKSPAAMGVVKIHTWDTDVLASEKGKISLEKPGNTNEAQYSNIISSYRIYKDAPKGPHVAFFINDGRKDANFKTRFNIKLNIPYDKLKNILSNKVTEIELPFSLDKDKGYPAGEWSKSGVKMTSAENYKRVSQQIGQAISKEDVRPLGGKMIIQEVYADGTIVVGFDILFMNDLASCQVDNATGKKSCQLHHAYIEGAAIIIPKTPQSPQIPKPLQDAPDAKTRLNMLRMIIKGKGDK